ncbi:MAG: hypothetical protein PVG07_09445 [Acidobacteriota bacterium]|jgi:hypothetical protein
MKKLNLILALLALALTVASPVAAQSARSALVYNDGTPELQTAYTAFVDQLTIQGTTVEATADAAYFGGELAAGTRAAYGAFGSDGVLLDSWLAQAPDNTQFLKVTLAPDGDLDTEFVSFQTPTASLSGGTGRRVVGNTNDGSLFVSEIENFSTRTADGQPAPAPVQPNGDLAGTGVLAPRELGWPWDGIVEAITDFFTGWFDDILEWLQNVGECAADCADTFLDNIPEGVEVEVTVEVQTTPPGVKTSITVKASGQAAAQLMREYAKLIECLAGCIANGGAGN